MDPLEPNTRTCPSTKQQTTAVNKSSTKLKRKLIIQKNVQEDLDHN